VLSFELLKLKKNIKKFKFNNKIPCAFNFCRQQKLPLYSAYRQIILRTKKCLLKIIKSVLKINRSLAGWGNNATEELRK